MFRRDSESPMLEAIASVENLTKAWTNVRRNIRVAQRGRSHGSDAITMMDFEEAWVEHMEQLSLELRTNTYRPLPPRQFLLAGKGGKQRTISILAIRDRIAQRAVLQVLEPQIEPTFLDCSYGFRPHVGVPYAIARIERYRQQGLHWVAHADIADCFGTIDHDILLHQLKQRIPDAAVLRLIDKWLNVGVLSETATTDASNWWDDGQELWDRLVEHGTQFVYSQTEGGMSMAGMGQFDPSMLDEPTDRAGLLRKKALQGLASNAALWGITYGKTIATGVKKALPLLKRVPGGGATLGMASLAALAAIPLSQRLLRERERGTLQGGAISPLLANIYLDPFDRAMTERGHNLVRFADDFILVGASQASVEKALSDAQSTLARLRMTTKPQKTSIKHFNDGVRFLGHEFVPTREDGSTPLRSFEEAKHRLQERMPKRKKGKQ